MTPLRALVRWWKANSFIVDAVAAVLICALAIGDVAMWDRGDSLHTDRGVFTYVLLAGQTLPLAYRRRYPIPVMYLLCASIGLYWMLDYPLGFDIAAMVGIYSVANHGLDRHRTWMHLGVVATGVTALAAIDWSADIQRDSATVALGFAGLHIASALLGEFVHQRRQRIVDLQERASLAEEALATSAREAVVEERSRIAREMHDVVAHGMSVITVQASAAQEIAHSNPDKTVEVLAGIETVGRESLSELRRMVGVLRDGEVTEPSLSPQPTLSDIAGAVAQSVEAGVETELIVTGHKPEVAAGIELTAFRIVQEALTNVRKHGGRSASAAVRVEYGENEITIEVSDDGAGATSSLSASGGGHGLIGMRERVDIYGGTFSAGARQGGGYLVRALLPTNEPRPGVPPTPSTVELAR